MSGLNNICGFCCEDILNEKEAIAVNLIQLHPQCLPVFRKRQKELQIVAYKQGKVFALPVLTSSQASLIEEISTKFSCHPLLVERIGYQRKWDKQRIEAQLPEYITYVERSKKVTRESVKNYLKAHFVYLPDGPHGLDHEGNQILYLMMGRFPGGLADEETKLWMNLVGEAYLALPASTKKGMCLVLSFENFGKNNMDMTASQSWLNAIQKVIPMRVAKMVAYKPSPIFGAFFAISRTFVSQKLRQRVFIVDDLKDLVPKENIPEEFGGVAKVDWAKAGEDFFALAERSWKLTEKK